MITEPPTAVSWTFSQPGVLSVLPNGWLSADASGALVTATAHVGGASASTSLTVVQSKLHAWAQPRALVVRPTSKFHAWGQSNVSVSHP
jgi:hypothetical protein